jgi:hypothetical protein
MRFRRASRILMLTAAVCVCSGIASAQTVRVQLKISADEPLRGSLQKSLGAELAALPGILPAGTAPDYTISVIALKIVTQSSKDVGVTLSVLVTERYETRISEFAESHVALEDRAQLISLLAGAVKPLAHWVETSSLRELKEVCRTIIQSFDRDVLKALRNSASFVPRQ